MPTTFSKFVDAGSYYSKAMAGEDLVYRAPGHEAATVTCIVREFSSSEKQIEGRTQLWQTATVQIRKADLATPVIRRSKFELRGICFNFEEMDPRMDTEVYVGFMMWSESPIRVTEQGNRRELS